MDEYIKREALLEAIDKAFDESPVEDTTAWMKGRRIVRTFPTADVEKVKHGMNAAKDYADCDQFVCPICGIELQDWVQVERDEDDGDITYHEYVFKRCPECGAKIDRWENENG